MKSFFKYFILPVIFVAIAGGWYYMYQKTYYDTNESMVKWISEHFNHSGELVDATGDLRVYSVDDIRLYVTDKKIKIEFGRATLTWRPEDFVTQENQDLLRTIYITMDNDPKDGHLRVFYKGTELKRWVS